jgi:hypothetical protein
MKTEAQLMAAREAVRRYRERHPDRVKLHNASPNSRAARARYERSEKCQEYRKRWAEKYEKDPTRIEKKRVYRRSPKGKALLKKGSRKQELKKFGISEAEYAAMLRAQRGVCAICHEFPNGTSLCVDHCHITGRRRGLLCHSCNMGIGNFSDDPNMLLRASIYLEG